MDALKSINSYEWYINCFSPDIDIFWAICLNFFATSKNKKKLWWKILVNWWTGNWWNFINQNWEFIWLTFWKAFAQSSRDYLLMTSLIKKGGGLRLCQTESLTQNYCVYVAIFKYESLKLLNYWATSIQF